jgi:multidrug efflux system membrane fusion protein
MDTKSRKFSVLLACGIVVIIAIWMLSGVGNEPPAANALGTNASTPSQNIVQQVRVQLLEAHEITREIIISARTEPDRYVEIKAEAEGVVESIDVDRGNRISKDQRLMSLDMRDREARRNEAQALLAQRELELKAQENLRGQQFTSEVQIAEARARVESARAALARIALEIDNTSIRAPFDGWLLDREVEQGDYVRVGDNVGVAVDLDPLVVVGEINEREVALLSVGSTGRATLVDGTSLTGTIRYLAPVADSSTRSFHIQVAVPNNDGWLKAGQSAELRVSADAVRVHTMSSALLSLADDGTIGVKVVDNNDQVRFYPVEIVGTSDEGMHVTGLPESIRLITVGQGFVTEGQRVNPVIVTSPESAATYERAD